jgi:hypothetical protein
VLPHGGAIRCQTKEEWIAVPVPDAGIPREVVETARAAIKDNRAPSEAGRRFWELSGGIVRCGVCGNAMDNRTMLKKTKNHSYFYHKCRKHHAYGDAGCPHGKNHRAEKLEAAAWKIVSGLLQDSARLREGLEDMIERERAGVHGDPARQAKAWLDKLAEVDRKRSRF